jgi:hypothetical protein
MIDHVYTFLAFFDNLGFVDVKAITRGRTKFSSLSDYFVASSFMLVNSQLVDSYIMSHQRLGCVMPYMKYNRFIWKSIRIPSTTFFKSCFAFQLVKFSTSPQSTFRASIRMKY